MYHFGITANFIYKYLLMCVYIYMFISQNLYNPLTTLKISKLL